MGFYFCKNILCWKFEMFKKVRVPKNFKTLSTVQRKKNVSSDNSSSLQYATAVQATKVFSKINGLGELLIDTIWATEEEIKNKWWHFKNFETLVLQFKDFEDWFVLISSKLQKIINISQSKCITIKNNRKWFKIYEIFIIIVIIMIYIIITYYYL